MDNGQRQSECSAPATGCMVRRAVPAQKTGINRGSTGSKNVAAHTKLFTLNMKPDQGDPTRNTQGTCSLEAQNAPRAARRQLGGRCVVTNLSYYSNYYLPSLQVTNIYVHHKPCSLPEICDFSKVNYLDEVLKMVHL